MIPTTTMQLPKPETGDQMEPFFLGTQPDGGYWMTVTRLSEHDHTGGLLGKPITAATIPDGSITTSKLDPSVLAPYAMADGSKPFTGQVTMQADAIIRDALFFGPQGSAAAPDVTLTRTAAGVLGLSGALSSASGTVGRLTIGSTGTLTVAPDAGAAALALGGFGTLGPNSGSPTSLQIGSAQFVYFAPSSNIVLPLTDNLTVLGYSTNRWQAVWAVSGTIQTSAAEAKTDITPLDPAAALAAVLATDPVTFTYTAPPATAAQYELPDDPEQAEAVLHQRLVNAPLMEAARSQAGFVLEDATGTYQTDPLFETGEGQSNAANSAGVLLGATHRLVQLIEDLGDRVTALEGVSGGVSGGAG